MDISLKGLLIQIADPMFKIMIAIGIASLVAAVINERRMQKHRRPGVSYGSATLRRDGGWKRSDLFDEQGLLYQRQAAKWGLIGAVSLLLAVLLAWMIGSLGSR